MERNASLVALGTYLMGVPVHYHPQHSCSYLVSGGTLGLVETGPTAAAKDILNRVRKLGFDPDRISVIAVTHIHADHAGGAGYLARQLPRATVYVHERGAKHLLDPSALIAGTKQVFGDDFETTAGPILAVPETQLHPLEDGEVIDLGRGHALEAVFTSGHVHHHLCFLDRGTRALFTGDAVGHYYPDLDLILPDAAPPNFDLDLTLRDLERLGAMDPSVLLFSHSGISGKPKESFELARQRIIVFGEIVQQAMHEDGTVEGVTRKLRAYCNRTFALPQDEDFQGSLFRVCELNAGGYLSYFARNKGKSISH